MNKSALRDQILAQLQTELATQTSAAHLARDEAISEESRPENKYDTHSQEAAYLAEGQARLAAEIRENLALYTSFTPSSFAETTPIALGALVELVDAKGRSSWYFLGPRAGGMEVNFENRLVLVLTPQSPFGRKLLGRRVGDLVELPGRGTSGSHRIARIL